MEAERLFVIGIIRSSHGLKGNVKVESTSGEAEHFFDLDEVTLRKDGREKVFAVENVQGGARNLLLKLKGIDSPEEAAKYRGAEIVVPRSKASPLKKGEFYVEDLKQCALIYQESGKKGLDSAPVVCGTITDVLEGGAGYLLEVLVSESLDGTMNSTDKAGGGEPKKRTALVPFKKEFIGTVDTERKTVQLMHLWILE